MFLGDLYKGTDYPREEDLRYKFKAGVHFMPIAESDDLRVNISDELVTAMRSKIEKELDNRILAATDDMLDRLRTSVRHMADTLRERNKIFRDTLVGNIRGLMETLPLLNFNKDVRIDAAIKLCAGLCVDTDRLRFNDQFRKEIAEKATQILERI